MPYCRMPQSGEEIRGISLSCPRIVAQMFNDKFDGRLKIYLLNSGIKDRQMGKPLLIILIFPA